MKARIVSGVVLLAASLSLQALMPGHTHAQRVEPIIADHTCADVSLIPDTCIERARSVYRITYGHTSHGSQIVTGMQLLMGESDLYAFDHDGSGDALSLHDYTPSGDLGDPTWAQRTRDYLNGAGADRNLVMWSWCGQVADATYDDIAIGYLGNMEQLEAEYPLVTFVYMTGHLDGEGEDGNLNIRNNQIRDYCTANMKVLFDFADIESYDPDGNYYVDRGADDNCDYDDGNWAVQWCAAHPDECPSCSCAHSQCLNCYRKGKAFWWMMARLAGSEGESVCQMRVRNLVMTKNQDDVQMLWDPSTTDLGYNVWYVKNDNEIPQARLASSPPAIGVMDCSAPAVATTEACVDRGAVTREAPSLFFYQVRTHCCGLREGP